MLFFASKLVEAALQPSNLIVFLAVLGLFALVLGRRRGAAWLLGLAATALVLAGWTPLGPAVLMPLEDRFPVPTLPAEVTGVVMLGGAVDTHITADRNSVALNDDSERIYATAALARRYPNARIILSGGITSSAQGLSESETVRRLLVVLGIPAARIEVEERSRTTWENAVESLAAAKPKAGETWLLVTSAYAMPRAVASFRAVKFPVLPYPVDYRTRPADLRRPVTSAAAGLTMTDTAAHEWLGLLVYRLVGRTREVLPAP